MHEREQRLCYRLGSARRVAGQLTDVPVEPLGVPARPGASRLADRSAHRGTVVTRGRCRSAFIHATGTVLRPWGTLQRTNYAGNHFHFYWDTFEADQVSSDAADRGVTQGDWHATDGYPDYTTTEATSVTQREESETLCVTAGDRDHAAVDATALDCVEVTAQLSELSS